MLDLATDRCIQLWLFASRDQSPIDRFENGLAGKGACRRGSQMLEHRMERSARHVLHVHEPHLAIGKRTLIEDTDNVGVVELRERDGLVSLVARDLESHEPLKRAL